MLYTQNEKILEEYLEKEKKEKQDLKDQFFGNEVKKGAYERIKNWEKVVAREAYRKLAKEGKNNLGDRLTVSFLSTASHFDNGFKDKVWHLESTWDKNKGEKGK